MLSQVCGVPPCRLPFPLDRLRGARSQEQPRRSLRAQSTGPPNPTPSRTHPEARSRRWHSPRRATSCSCCRPPPRAAGWASRCTSTTRAPREQRPASVSGDLSREPPRKCPLVGVAKQLPPNRRASEVCRQCGLSVEVLGDAFVARAWDDQEGYERQHFDAAQQQPRAVVLASCARLFTARAREHRRSSPRTASG